MEHSATASSPPTLLFLSIDPSLAVEDVARACQPILNQVVLDLKNNPRLRIHLLFSGNVIDWFLEARPPFLREIAALHTLGQVHLLQGVLYAPLIDEGKFDDHIRQAALYKDFWHELSLPVEGVALGRFRWEKNLPLLAQHLGEKYCVVQTPRAAVTRGTPNLFGAALYSPSGEQRNEEIQCFVADETTSPKAVHSFLAPGRDRTFATGDTKLASLLPSCSEDSLCAPPRSHLFAGDSLLFQRRLAVLETELERVRHETKHLSPQDPLSIRFRKAERFFLRAQAGEFVLSPSEHDLSKSIQIRQHSFDSIIRAQVEIDAIQHPDIDPNVGWVRPDDTSKMPSFIDTQLLRLVFSEKFEITEFDYKPRKANLSPCLEPPRSSASLSLLPLPRSAKELSPLNDRSRERGGETRTLTTKRTPGLLSIRAYEDLKEATCVRELTLRAGIGAHLSNATTGFSVEYWLEERESLTTNLGACLEFHLLLPSALQKGLIIKPLQCVGGVSSKQLPIDESSLVTIQEVPGGVYGVRLIDTAHQFLLDLRSAKQLSSVGVTPTLGGSTAVTALSIRLFVEAGRILSDSRSNTVFLSIE